MVRTSVPGLKGEFGSWVRTPVELLMEYPLMLKSNRVPTNRYFPEGSMSMDQGPLEVGIEGMESAVRKPVDELIEYAPMLSLPMLVTYAYLPSGVMDIALGVVPVVKGEFARGVSVPFAPLIV